MTAFTNSADFGDTGKRPSERSFSELPTDRRDPDIADIAAAKISGGPMLFHQIEDQYDGAGEENALAMGRVHVFRFLTGKSYHDLELFLRRRPIVREELGLDGVPDHNTMSLSLREQFADTLKDRFIKNAKKVAEKLRRFGFYNQDTFIADEIGETDSKRDSDGSEQLTDAQKRRAVSNTWQMIGEDFDFARQGGTEWSTEYMFNVFAEGANKGITPYEVLDKERKGEGSDASHKAVMNAAGNRSPMEWCDELDGIFDTLFTRMQAVGYFTRSHDAYIDGTTRPFWPSGELPDGVKGGDVKESTNYAWQFATLVVDDQGVQCPAAMVPITDDRPTHKQIEELVERASSRVNLDLVKADGAYSGARCQQVLEESSANDYIVRGSRRGKEIQRHLTTMTGTHDSVDSYTTTSADGQVRAQSRLVAEPDWDYADREALNTVPNSDQQGLGAFTEGPNPEAVDLDDIDSKLWRCRRPYLTSLDGDPEDVADEYDKRWVVEDNYANTKRNQLGKTDSPNHSIQTFVWGLAMVFSAVWAAARVFLRLDHPELIPDDRPTISAREVVVFIKLEYG